MHERGERVAEKILDNIRDTFADGGNKQKSVRFFDDGTSSISTQMNRLFGRQKSIHNILGGGKSADVMLWRNKKISSGMLVGATAVWLIFEWLDYHFVTITCFSLVIGMIIQFVWTNASGMLNRSTSDVPRLVLPDDLFVNLAVAMGTQINQFLSFIQDVACGRNLKQFIMVVAGLWAAAMIGSCCNFLTVIYIGYISAHTLPALYERYEDQVDDFVYRLLGLARDQYKKLDEGVLSRIPKGSLKSKKSD